MIVEMRDRDGVDALVDAAADNDDRVRRRCAVPRCVSSPIPVPCLGSAVVARTDHDRRRREDHPAGARKLGLARRYSRHRALPRARR